MKKAYLVLETGEAYQGFWRNGDVGIATGTDGAGETGQSGVAGVASGEVEERAGEVVFNTSHSGYEEMSTDPSYYSQILVMTATMQGNYGSEKEVWESRKPWIHGFVCLELQDTVRDSSWKKMLDEAGIPILSDTDTREITLRLRDGGAVWGAIVKAEGPDEARSKAKPLIEKEKSGNKDWAFEVSEKEIREVEGFSPRGPKVGIVDFGCKENIVRELQSLCSKLVVFPCRTSADEIRKADCDGLMLSNGPGDPEDVEVAVETVQSLLGEKPIYGVCMGHQILSKALGAKTFKLKFGHRGANHPVKDLRLNKIYVTSQNHGYAVEDKSLPSNIQVSHVNLNDGTVEGIYCAEKKCSSVQFHPESHPGPRDAQNLFNEFVKSLT